MLMDPVTRRLGWYLFRAILRRLSNRNTTRETEYLDLSSFKRIPLLAHRAIYIKYQILLFSYSSHKNLVSHDESPG